MNPAFSAPQLRTFLTLFQDIGVKVCAAPAPRSYYYKMDVEQLCDKWKSGVLDSPDKTVYVNKWLARTTLDIIGEGLPPFPHRHYSANEAVQLRLPTITAPLTRGMTVCRKYTAIFCESAESVAGA